jgi:hypothetical protein
MRSQVDRHSEEAERAVRDTRRATPPPILGGRKGAHRDRRACVAMRVMPQAGYSTESLHYLDKQNGLGRFAFKL